MSTEAFRTLEVSDPQYEADGLRLVTVKSPALGNRADLTLWIPERLPDAPVPLVILLHGVYGSHWAWAWKGGAHRTARDLIARGEIPPLVLAMPSDGLWGDGSGYVSHGREDFERWIVDEVPAAARQVVGDGRLGEKFFLSGLSMGGFGALRLGARHAGRCAGISAHSAITAPEQMAQFVEEELASYHRAGPVESALDAILAHRGELPPLRFDCGLDDNLLEPNRQLHRGLLEHGIDHAYEEFPGGHEWDYWRDHLADTLRFFATLQLRQGRKV